MHHKVLGGDGPEGQVEVASGKTQGLRGGFRQLDVVPSRNGACDPVDGTLEALILK